jgi:hypothetical protein
MFGKHIRPALLACIAAMPALAAPPPDMTSTQFNCDAINVPVRLNPNVSRDLQPAHSLDAAQAVLERHKVPFERSRGTMTMSGVPQKVVDQIYRLPQGEPVILPNGQGMTICVLRPSADSY